MSDLYSKAAKAAPEMAREARDRQAGQQSLAFDVDVGSDVSGYVYEPPIEPGDWNPAPE